MATEVIGIDHIYVTVKDLSCSEKFYDRFMPMLGFKKSSKPIDGDPHIHYYGKHFGFSLRPAKTRDRNFDPYAPGMHHFCFRVNSTKDVTEVYEKFIELGIEATQPKLYSEYAEDYTAIFFQDPDGIRLEVTNYREQRKRHFREFS